MSKIFTTNYINTFIEVADDCPVHTSEVPKKKGTIAYLQYKMLNNSPYKHTSDDILFLVYAARKGFKKETLSKKRQDFFTKGQPCFRSSPLTKKFGWGIHSNGEGKIALVPQQSASYKKLKNDPKINQKKALRSKRI